MRTGGHLLEMQGREFNPILVEIKGQEEWLNYHVDSSIRLVSQLVVSQSVMKVVGTQLKLNSRAFLAKI